MIKIQCLLHALSENKKKMDQLTTDKWMDAFVDIQRETMIRHHYPVSGVIIF